MKQHLGGGEISDTEQENMLSLLGLYLHIPFCRSKCSYCDFYSMPCAERQEARKLMQSYTDALLLHMEDYAGAASHHAVDTVFIGGGTPTVLPVSMLRILLDQVDRCFNLTENAEITIEANPETVSRSSLRSLRRAGVNRLSMGLQSADDSELRLLGRIHDSNGFGAAFADARAAGIGNINIDLMYGIPGQTPESLRRTLEYAVALDPEHISLYGLKIEENTPFGRQREALEPYLPDEDTELEMYLDAIDFLASSGFIQYEISNFAREGYACRHNLKYWRCEEYLGLGPAAHSYLGGVRFAYTRNFSDYIKALEEPDKGVIILSERSRIDEDERAGEYIMLGLRLTEGVDMGSFAERFGFDFTAADNVRRKLHMYVENGFMTADAGRLALTPKGMFVSNYIISSLIPCDREEYAGLRSGTEL